MKRKVLILVSVIVFLVAAVFAVLFLTRTPHYQEDEGCTLKYEGLKDTWRKSENLKGDIPDALLQDYVHRYCATEILILMAISNEDITPEQVQNVQQNYLRVTKDVDKYRVLPERGRSDLEIIRRYLEITRSVRRMPQGQFQTSSSIETCDPPDGSSPQNCRNTYAVYVEGYLYNINFWEEGVSVENNDFSVSHTCQKKVASWQDAWNCPVTWVTEHRIANQQIWSRSINGLGLLNIDWHPGNY